jgi:polyisoprenoid-binding protein YceI
MTRKIKWSIDPEKSIISFDVSPLIFASVHGTFRKFEADIYTTGNDFSTIQINLRIDASSISTGDEERDEHLKSPDFFDVKEHRFITFSSKSVKFSESGKFHELKGDLTIKGLSKEVELQVEFDGLLTDSNGSDFAEFTIKGNAYRSDWGLIWKGPETGGLMEGAVAEVFCRIMLIKEQKKIPSI